MVRKRHTYEFHSLITSSFDNESDDDIMYLIRGLTFEERSLLLEMNIDHMISLLFYEGGGNINSNQTDPLKNEFRRRWNRARIVRFLSQCDPYPHEQIWEIPKGHFDHNKDKTQRDAAVREFMEETQLRRSDFTVLPYRPMTFDHEDRGIKYKTIYWIAEIEGNPELKINYGEYSTHHKEVSALAWLNEQELRQEQRNRYKKRSIAKIGRLLAHYRTTRRGYRKQEQSIIRTQGLRCGRFVDRAPRVPRGLRWSS